MNMHLFEAAMSYRDNGLSVIVVQADKRSLGQWRQFQTEIIDVETLRDLLADNRAGGVAVVCGSVSGGLEVIDIDMHNDPSGAVFRRFTNALHQSGILRKLVICQTRSGGYHLLFRSQDCQRNQVLARRWTSADELKQYPDVKTKVLIETRGEGGYFVTAPTPGYKIVQGSLLEIPFLSTSERQQILSAAKRLNTYERQAPANQTSQRSQMRGYLSPFDDYDARGDVLFLLQKHGWLIVGSDM